MDSLSSNIDSKKLYHLHWDLIHTTVLVCYQPLNIQVFWYLLNATSLYSHKFSICGSEISL